MPVLQFTRFEFPEFGVEHADDQGSLVVHFFRPKQGCGNDYWDRAFAEALNGVAPGYFRMGLPELAAQRVREFEIDSWWLRAEGVMTRSLAPEALVQGFYRAMAAWLATANRSV